MADFTALKTAIQNAIKQNGNEEITGNLLQDVLLAIVTTLGEGNINNLINSLDAEVTARQQAVSAEAQARQLADSTLQGGINTVSAAITAINNAIGNGCVYAGIATPSSTPASGKVFYLALTAGTYTNFNNLEVPQGINILKNNGSTWLLDSFLGIDDAPTPSSNKMVKSGGVFNDIMTNGSAFDLSAYNNGTTYADLNAALTALNALPAAYKKGGMSMKYVRTFDNKYIQYRCKTQSFSVEPEDWAICEENLIIDSSKYLKIYTDKNGKIYLAVDISGNIIFGSGVPTQIKDFINALLSEKVNKEEGKGLIPVQYIQEQNINGKIAELISQNQKLVSYIREDGTVVIPFLESSQIKSPRLDEMHEYIEKLIESEIKIDTCIVCPEDFEGLNISEQVENANDFINEMHGSCIFYFGQTKNYLINKAITLPSNTTMIIDDCEIKLANGVHDNIIRTSNLIPQSDDISDLAEYMGLCQSSGKLENIKILGHGNAVLSGPDIRHFGPTSLSDPTVVEYKGDQFGWRGISVYPNIVENIEICGFTIKQSITWSIMAGNCVNGKFHDLNYDNHGSKNGDGCDLLSCHDIDIYNIAGYTQDDSVAVATIPNSDPSGDFAFTALRINDYIFGAETYNVNINNIHAGGVIGHQVILYSQGNNAIHDIHISNLYDNEDSSKAGILRLYGPTYIPETTSPDVYYNIFVNNIDGRNAARCVIVDTNGVIWMVPINSHFNNMYPGQNNHYFVTNSNSTIANEIFVDANCKKTNLK